MIDLGKLIKHAANQMSRSMDKYAKQFGLTGTQMSILNFIGTRTDVLQRDIEDEFNIQRSTATIALQRMEKRGLIERRPASTDARQKLVIVTSTAASLQQLASDYITQQQQTINAEFTPSEQELITQLLNRFIEMNGGQVNERTD